MVDSTRGLAGRETELRRLEGAIRTAADGRPSRVLVLGEAGIGKTRLLDAAAEMAAMAGLRALRGTAIQSGSSIQYLPLIGPLSACLDEPSRGGDLEPIRRAIRGGQPGRSALPFEGARLVEAIFGVLTRRPTLLIVDDIHWADGSTVAVLDYLAHRSEVIPLAVIAAARDDEPGLLDRVPFADGRRFSMVRLGRLTRSEVGEQVGALIGRRPHGTDLDLLFARTAGNPFFVEQVIHEAAGLVAGQSPSDQAPAALRGVLLRRVARLPGDARRVVDALAILGRPADDALVTAVSGLGEGAVREGIAAATTAGVVRASVDGQALRHPLFAEVLIAELAGPTRRELHTRAAETLAARAGGGPSELANQWWQAGVRDRAWAAALVAADAAAASAAFTEERVHLERALEVWPADRAGRANVLLRAAHAAWVADDAAGAVRLAEAAEGAGSPPLDLALAIGTYAWDAGDRRRSARAFARIEGLVDEQTPGALRARALWGLGRARSAAGLPEDAVKLAREAAAVAHGAGEPALEAEALGLAAMALAFAGRLDGIGDLERALPLTAGRATDRPNGHVAQFLVDLAGIAGDRERALEVARFGMTQSERLGLARSHGADLRGRAALLLLDAGSWDEADEIVEPAEPRAFPSLARAYLAMRRGEADEARQELEVAARGGSIGGPGALGGWLELARVELAWLDGDRAGALRELGAVPAVPGVWGVDVEAWRAHWAARLGAPPRTGESVPELTEVAGRHPDPHLAAALAAEIEAELTSGDDPDAPGRWSTAGAAWSSAGRPYHAAYSALREAEARLAANDRDAARAALRSATTTLATLQAEPVLARANDLARRARLVIEPQPRYRSGSDELTDRERDVLVLLADGLTNALIAEQLFLSPKTVGIHVTRILSKLEAHTRGEAVAVARRRGMLP